MKQIPLTRGMVALVDDEDYDRLAQFSWYAARKRNTYYAVRNTKAARGKIRMHRVVMQAPDDPLIDVDHINRNGLDNRKENLRVCTRRENTWNMRSQSEYGPGVTRIKNGHGQGYRYRARIVCAGKRISIGCFATPEEARAAVTSAERLTP